MLLGMELGGSIVGKPPGWFEENACTSPMKRYVSVACGNPFSLKNTARPFPLNNYPRNA